MSSSGGEKKPARSDKNGVNISSQLLEGEQKDGCVNCSLHTLLTSVIFQAQRATTCLRTLRHTAGSRKEADRARACMCVQTLDLDTNMLLSGPLNTHEYTYRTTQNL